jgi:hypothetical protein
VEPSDLSGVDERLRPRRREPAQPHGESIREKVGESVQRGIVVVARLRVGPGLGAKWDWRL